MQFYLRLRHLAFHLKHIFFNFVAYENVLNQLSRQLKFHKDRQVNTVLKHCFPPLNDIFLFDLEHFLNEFNVSEQRRHPAWTYV